MSLYIDAGQLWASCNDMLGKTVVIVSFNVQSVFVFIDAGQVCASCNDIVRVDDCHRSVRCDNDQAGLKSCLTILLIADVILFTR